MFLLICRRTCDTSLPNPFDKIGPATISIMMFNENVERNIYSVITAAEFANILDQYKQ